MTGREILLDARMCFALGRMEYGRKFATYEEARLAHNRARRAAVKLGFKIIKKHGEKGYRFSHAGEYLYIYYTGDRD